MIGEGSYLLAQKCFPTENISGSNGHGATDVTCKSPLSFVRILKLILVGCADIVFDQVLPKSAYNKNYITNFETLKTMGDSLVGKLVGQLAL